MIRFYALISATLVRYCRKVLASTILPDYWYTELLFRRFVRCYYFVFFSERVIDIWNSLPSNAVDFTSLARPHAGSGVVRIAAQGCRLRNDLYCVEWDVKL